MKNNKFIAWLLVFSLLLSIILPTTAVSYAGGLNDDAHDEVTISKSAIDPIVKAQLDKNLAYILSKVVNPTVGTSNGEWSILSLARANYPVPSGYYDKYYENVLKVLQDSKGVLSTTKYTEHSRLVLGLTSIGKGVTDVGGYNQLEKLADYNTVLKQGVNGPIFALIAFDSNNYEIPQVQGVALQTTREMMINYILDQEIKKGTDAAAGWALGSNTPDPDITGMVLQSLAPYYDTQVKVKAAVDRALNWLSINQKADGGFASLGTVNTESTAQIIVALTALGIDPQNDSRFVKSGKSTIDSLLTFALPDGGFRHLITGGVNAIATDQGTYALVAYDRFVNGKTRLYDMTDLRPAQPEPTATPTAEPTATPTVEPTATPTVEPTATPTAEPTTIPTAEPTAVPTAEPTAVPTAEPTAVPTAEPTATPTAAPTPTAPTAVIGYATLSVDKLTINKGYVVKSTNVELRTDDTVWSVLQRILDNSGISYDYSWDAEYGSVYVESIAGDGEFDHGTGSGWMYNVNGQYPNYGASQYVLRDGDMVQWRYTTNLGVDLGEKSMSPTSKPSATPTPIPSATPTSLPSSTPIGQPPVGKPTPSTTPTSTLSPTPVGQPPVAKLVELNKLYSDAGAISKWAYEAVLEATKQGFIQGSNGKINPKSDITRAEFTKILVTVLDLDITTNQDNRYKDVSQADWFYPYVNTASTAGFITGYNNEFHPNEKITREQMATIIIRALGVKPAKLTTAIKDMDAASAWARTDIETSAALELMLGQNNLFNPKDVVTREMATVVVIRVYDYKNGNKLEVRNVAPVDKVDNKEQLSVKAHIQSAGDFLQKTVVNPGISSIGGDWTVLGLARSGIKVPDAYYAKYYANVEKALKEKAGKLHAVKYTEYDRVILALASLGKKVDNVAGYNLLEPLADFDTLIKQGINGPIFALIALDSNHYDIPIVKGVKTQTTREMLIDFILKRELSGGGWALGERPDVSDPDITAMVIQGLAPYYSINDRVKVAVDRGVEWLSKAQTTDGGFASWESTNAESIAQVIVGLVSVGINPHTDSRFIKNGHSAVEALLSFAASSGGFYHIKPGGKDNGGAKPGEVDLMATDQSMYALVAYDRFINGHNHLYDMTDVK